MFWNRTPLAWKNLSATWTKLVLSIGGIGFAVLLMFSQIGFRNGLFDSTVEIARLLKADLFIVSRARYNLPSEQRFSRNLLDRARQIDGVEAILPIYIERSSTELRVLGKPSRSIRVIGVPLEDNVFIDKTMNDQLKILRSPGTALLDRRTKPMYGLERNAPARLRDQQVELSGKSIQFVGYTEIGTDFVHDGSLILSRESFAEYFPWRTTNDPLSIVDIASVQIRRVYPSKPSWNKSNSSLQTNGKLSRRNRSFNAKSDSGDPLRQSVSSLP